MVCVALARSICSLHYSDQTGCDCVAATLSCTAWQDVVDGDLCEQFTTLDAAKQRMIADELDRTPGEVAKKLEDMRNRIL